MILSVEKCERVDVCLVLWTQKVGLLTDKRKLLIFALLISKSSFMNSAENPIFQVWDFVSWDFVIYIDFVFFMGVLLFDFFS